MQWEYFFKEQLNGNESRTSPQGNQSQKFQNNEDVPPPTRAEVDKDIQRLKNNKSAGTDGIPAELLKTAGASFNRIFHQILTNIWSSEKMPQEWNLSIICPVF
ncbi:hypothetical protein ABN196_17975 [Proteus terrae]|uniref:hypothetical protein n=1 Tax=Proteus terrae TaxID=1574161 RepID=UPI0032DB864D